MKLTKKLFIAIMTLALLVITFGTSTFAWFTLGTESKIENVNVNVTAGKGMEISLDGKKWRNNITLEDNTVDFTDLTSADGIAIKEMDGAAARKEASGTDLANYFEQVIYVRVTKDATTGNADFTKVVLDFVAGKDATFTAANGDTTATAGDKVWLSDATLETVSGLNKYTDSEKTIEENKYYRFDPLNAVKISFQANAKTTAVIYGYENAESWGGAAKDELAKDYADAKDYSIDTYAANETLPTYVTYTKDTNTTADASGFVKYDQVAQNAEKSTILSAASTNGDFGAFSTLGLDASIVGDDTNYLYAKLTIRVWLEGWDADCINAILEKNTVINLGIKAE